MIGGADQLIHIEPRFRDEPDNARASTTSMDSGVSETAGGAVSQLVFQSTPSRYSLRRLLTECNGSLVHTFFSFEV